MRPPPERAALRGFTLIELMIVISIVAIIVAMGVPSFVRGLRKEGLRKAVSDVVEGCSQARALAILQGQPTELVIRAEDGQLLVRQLQSRPGEIIPGPLRTGQTGAAASSAVSNYRANLPDEIAVKQLDVNFKDHMEFPEARVRFFPNGTCDEFTIILSSLAEERLVSLDVVTALAGVKVIR